MARLAVLLGWFKDLGWLVLKGSHDFLHTFSMALHYKWGVKTDFIFALQFFMLISDGRGGVYWLEKSIYFGVKKGRNFCNLKMTIFSCQSISIEKHHRIFYLISSASHQIFPIWDRKDFENFSLLRELQISP